MMKYQHKFYLLTWRKTAVSVDSMVAKFSLEEDPEKPPEPPEKAGDTLGGTNGAEAPTTSVLELM